MKCIKEIVDVLQNITSTDSIGNIKRNIKMQEEIIKGILDKAEGRELNRDEEIELRGNKQALRDFQRQLHSMTNPGESLKESVQEKHIVTLEVSPKFMTDSLPMLSYIKQTAGIGHSFQVEVDPESPDYKKRFGVDGDGSSHIYSIKLDGKEYDIDFKKRK